ncbi:MAG: HIT family protein [Desulfovibrionaceae bacterium]
MEYLWAPWRMDYILRPKEGNECIFCVSQEEMKDDEDRLILYKGNYAFIIMNKYPYNCGHIMVVPYKHTANILDITEKEYMEIYSLQRKSVQVLEKIVKPSGFNIGLNIGEIAGSGIKEHLHFHIVPRWVGDSSFLAVLADTRTVPEHIRETYIKLKTEFMQ